MKGRKYILILTFVLSICFGLLGQNTPVIMEAESGTVGADFSEVIEGDVTYLTPSTEYNNASCPGIADKVISFQVTFADSGTYKLFARIRIGPAGADDDSFYYGSGFGSKDPANGDAWTTCNNLHTAGFTIIGDVVADQGDASTQVWKWLALSDYTGYEDPLSFRVELDGLTQTFVIGARENGFDIDKLAFGRAGLYYTVDNLDKGEAGSTTLPGEEPIGPPLAYGLDKFLGCGFGPDTKRDFAGYWNQVTPGNAGKWGWVEGSRDNMSWNDYDEAYQLAMDSDFLFKHHVLVWGNQQPHWIGALDSAAQREEIVEWFNAVNDRYPGIGQIEVVNEPLHDPPDDPADPDDGAYYGALGGPGVTGWDWVLESFRLAREIFPDTTDLLINEYSIMNDLNNTDEYLKIIKLLMAEDLIDGIGFQAHGFSHTATNQTILRNLDTLASTGLPLYVTELDIDGYTDRQQVRSYMNLFPLFWEHPSIQGVTLWGFRPGMWRTEQMAYLIDGLGEERPAMTWLRAYLKDEFVANESITISTESGESTINTQGGQLQMLAEFTPNNTTLTTAHWTVSNKAIATISEKGILTAVSNGTVTITGGTLELGSTLSDVMEITIAGQNTSVESITGLDNLTIFPNPATDGFFTIRGMEAIQEVVIINLNGKQIATYNVQDLNNLDFHLNAPAGMYVLRLSDGKQFYHTKIVSR